ncbi:hypothetical protein Q9L58_000393 [Maublancomyces gigas]|uniref:GED domain-containing protein n=1 Tax=Discina gigas TaxID=1032678 RepID=A0ABR3GWZ3_9PEZI
MVRREEEYPTDHDAYTRGPVQSDVCGSDDTITPTTIGPQVHPIEEVLQTDAGLEILGGGMRRMVDLVNRLRASGIEDLGLPLPRIAVVGNQSAGKSSLIEAISGIKVPRYTGTCTRCPLEINLSESNDPAEAWNCRISLRFKKRYDPSLAAKPSRSSNNSNRTHGSPWVDQPTEQVSFLDITDKNQVEPVLVAAQRAVLNPSKNWREYVYELRPGSSPHHAGGKTRAPRPAKGEPGVWSGFPKRQTMDPKKNAEEDFEVKFSPNVVCMEITGPELPNLAFIDLPGVIQTTESESEHYLIDLVTDLVKEYVQEEDCLIMLAMTMKDDAVNQSAARLAREFGEERTIGALTKPDTVGPGEYDQWINILRGNSHRLKHGYFVTKQPNQEQLTQGIDHAQARAQEAEFFKNTDPWKGELLDLKDRFGTQALQSYLAKELGELIRKRLPQIIDSIRKQHAEVKEELSSLPPPPTDNQTFLVHNLIRDFDTTLGCRLRGDSGHNDFQKDLRRTAEEFQQALKKVRPTIFLIEDMRDENTIALSLDSPRKAGASGRGNRRENEWFGDREREASPSLRKGRRNQQPEIHLLSSDEGPGSQSKRRRGTNDQMATPVSKRSKRTPGENESHKFNLPQIRHIIDSTATARIPGQVDPSATTNFIKQTLVLWSPIVNEFLDSCGQLLNELVNQCFSSIFKEYKKSPIYKAVWDIITRLVNESFHNQKAAVQYLLELEQEQVTTLNEEDYQRHTESHLRILSDRRARNIEDQNTKEAQTLAAEMATTEAKKNGDNVTPRKKRGPLPISVREGEPDPYKKEIGVLATVKAYSEVAQKRFVDNVYMSIQSGFTSKFRAIILETLQTGLGLKGPDVAEICSDLLVEDPQKEQRRKELLGRIEQLTRAMDELSRL